MGTNTLTAYNYECIVRLLFAEKRELFGYSSAFQHFLPQRGNGSGIGSGNGSECGGGALANGGVLMVSAIRVR